MNFLAHIFLAAPDEQWMIGGFIADSVKGKNHQLFQKKIAEGILMHRFIDSYTDEHPLVRDCTKLLRDGLGKYAPVALDVFFDYFLANNFHLYHHQTLNEFSKSAYELFYRNFEILPSRNQHLLPYMSQQNWLLNYSTIEGMKNTLAGMAQRSTHGAIMKGGEKYLIEYEMQLQNNFELFFDELQKKLADYKQDLK